MPEVPPFIGFFYQDISARAFLTEKNTVTRKIRFLMIYYFSFSAWYLRFDTFRNFILFCGNRKSNSGPVTQVSVAALGLCSIQLTRLLDIFLNMICLGILCLFNVLAENADQIPWQNWFYPRSYSTLIKFYYYSKCTG